MATTPHARSRAFSAVAEALAGLVLTVGAVALISVATLI